MEKSTKTIKQKLKTIWTKVKPFLTFKMALCFGIAWMITNGWSIVLVFLGTYLDIPWMLAVGGGYYALLWLPVFPEKIVTIAIAFFLEKLLFGRKKQTEANNANTRTEEHRI